MGNRFGCVEFDFDVDFDRRCLPFDLLRLCFDLELELELECDDGDFDFEWWECCDGSSDSGDTARGIAVEVIAVLPDEVGR